MNEVPEEKVLRKTFSEVIKGCTKTSLNGKDLFIRHFGNEDQAMLEENYQEIYDKAKKNGLPTTEESLELLMEEDLWTKQEEGEIHETELYLNNLQETKKNLIIPSQIENINKDIEEAQKKFEILTVKKNSLLTETCESYSQKRNNDYSIYLCLYKDPNLSKRFFSWDEFCEAPKAQLTAIFETYLQAVKDLSIRNIKYLALSELFSSYYNILGGKNLFRFFDKPVYELTFYQLNLLNYAKVLHSILENVQNIPEEVKKHPDDLLAYAESSAKNRKIVEKSQNKQGFSVVGASKTDMDEMGVSDQLAMSPFELAKKKGSLTIEDFQNFS